MLKNILGIVKLHFVKFQVPADFEKTVAVVGIEGAFGDYTFKSYGLVMIVKSSTLAMIQTDMFDYKPSQKVRPKAPKMINNKAWVKVALKEYLYFLVDH